MDNSNTKREHVSRTYKGFDGYAPIAAYLGNEGWCVANELDDWETLREGKRVAIFSESVGEEYGDNSYTVRRVFRITERTIDKNGQRRIIPDVQVDASSTSFGDREKHNDSAIISFVQGDPKAALATHSYGSQTTSFERIARYTLRPV